MCCCVSPPSETKTKGLETYSKRAFRFFFKLRTTLKSGPTTAPLYFLLFLQYFWDLSSVLLSLYVEWLSVFHAWDCFGMFWLFLVFFERYFLVFGLCFGTPVWWRSKQGDILCLWLFALVTGFTWYVTCDTWHMIHNSMSPIYVVFSNNKPPTW